MKRTTLMSLLSLSFGLTLAGCMNNGDDHNAKAEKKAEAPAAPMVRSITPAKTITVDTMSDLAGTNALSLADSLTIQSMTVKLVCADYSDTDPTNLPEELQAGTPFTIYGQPAGCSLRLLAFKADGKSFAPKAGANFTSYLPGDAATFTDGTTEYKLRVDTQLANPIAGDSVVRYCYSQILRDADVELEGVNISVTDHQVLIDGESAPALGLVKAELVAKNAKKAGIKLTLACDEAIVGTTLATATCKGDKIKDLEMHLGQDPGGDLDLASLASLFAAQSKKIGAYATASLEGGKVTMVIGLDEIGCQSLKDLSGKRLVFAVRRVGGGSVRYAYINIPQVGGPTIPAGASCHYAKSVTIASGEVYVDKSKPRFAAAEAKNCSIVSYETFACVDGKIFGPQNVEGTFASCKSCGNDVAQSKLEY